MSERKEVGTARKVHLSSGLCIGPELVAAPWLKAGGVREPVGGEPLCPHSEVRCSQHDFITLFRLVENFRTSDIPCVRTEASSKGVTLPSIGTDAGRGLPLEWGQGGVSNAMFVKVSALLGGGAA